MNSTNIARHAFKVGIEALPSVKNVIAVASGKGGVGKSTSAVNLALALSKGGAKVGILDADIYGPSIPTMLGVSDKPDSLDGKTMEPLEKFGLKIMSIGLLVGPDNAMIWRGPMASQALEQMVRQTNWGDLDYLVIDLPPGTGDIQLSLAQKVPLVGAVIVTTPQDVALLDAKKAVLMFEKVQIPVLGLIENMSMHVCSQCGHVEHIFGEDGGKRMAERMGLAYLGALPLSTQIRVQSDSGTPIVISAPESESAKSYESIATKVAEGVAALPKDYSSKFGVIGKVS